MKSSRILRMALACSAGLLLTIGCTHESTESGQDEPAPTGAAAAVTAPAGTLPAAAAQKLRVAPEYKVVEGTEGALRQATLYAQKVPSLGMMLEVRSLVLLPKKTSLPADRETLYEVITGAVESENGEEHTSHRTGDLWMVSPNARVTVKAQGEIAVLRAIAVSGK
jgi:hypothetical protein